MQANVFCLACSLIPLTVDDGVLWRNIWRAWDSDMDMVRDIYHFDWIGLDEGKMKRHVLLLGVNQCIGHTRDGMAWSEAWVDGWMDTHACIYLAKYKSF